MLHKISRRIVKFYRTFGALSYVIGLLRIVTPVVHIPLDLESLSGSDVQAAGGYYL